MTKLTRHKIMWTKMAEFLTDDWLSIHGYSLERPNSNHYMLDMLKEETLYSLNIGFPDTPDQCFLCDLYNSDLIPYGSRCTRCPLGTPCCVNHDSLFKRMLRSQNVIEMRYYMQQIAKAGEE